MRAHRTRQSILDTARELFLARGYAGTSVADITTACGISRAGFYTYFQDKLDVFAELGRASYRASRQLAARLAELPDPWTHAGLAGWVREYFDFLDEHGSFVIAATHAGPTDSGFRADARRTQLRVARALGEQVARHRPAGPPETTGLVLVAMLEQTWFRLGNDSAPTDRAGAVRGLAAMVLGPAADGLR